MQTIEVITCAHRNRFGQLATPILQSDLAAAATCNNIRFDKISAAKMIWNEGRVNSGIIAHAHIGREKNLVHSRGGIS